MNTCWNIYFSCFWTFKHKTIWLLLNVHVIKAICHLNNEMINFKRHPVAKAKNLKLLLWWQKQEFQCFLQITIEWLWKSLHWCHDNMGQIMMKFSIAWSLYPVNQNVAISSQWIIGTWNNVCTLLFYEYSIFFTIIYFDINPEILMILSRQRNEEMLDQDEPILWYWNSIPI